MASDVAARVAQIAPSATLAVDAKARALRAAGTPVIGFGAGEPDFDTPAHIVEAAIAACARSAAHHYSPTEGQPELRDAIAVRASATTGREWSRDDVVVTNGGKHAIFGIFQVLLDPGDEVIIPAPYWVTYPEAVQLASGVPVAVATDESSGFRATVEQLERARSSKTKLLVFVSPSNPTGAVYTPEQTAAIGRWAAAHGIWVLTDEIYQDLVYGGARASSILEAAPEVADRCVIADGVAKSYAMTGWRVGWIIGPREVVQGAAALQSHLTSNVNNVAQAAALAALTGPQECISEFRDIFEKRRGLMLDGLSAIDGVTCAEPEGAFYVFPNLSGVLGRPIGGRDVGDTLALAEALLETAQVAFVPGEGFGAPGYGRFSYATSERNITEGIERIAAALAG